MSKVESEFYIRGFDGLRAVSIIMVLLTHLGAYDTLLKTTSGTRLWFTISGEMGVYIFFCLSGFLITTLLLREKAVKGFISYKRFLARRFLRLMPPLFVFYMVVLFLMLYGSLDFNLPAFTFSIVYLYNFIPNKFYQTELGHTWSLAVEEQFYFLWPFIIKYFKKVKQIAVILLAITVCFAAVEILPGLQFNFNDEWFALGDKFKVQRWFLPAIAPIMSGAAFAWLNFYHSELAAEKKGWWLVAAIALLGCAFYLPLHLKDYFMIFQSMGAVCLINYINNNPFCKLTNVLERAPFSFIGKMSYSIYVWQGLFLRTGPGGVLWVQQWPQNIILTFVTALGSYLLIEKKIKVLRSNFR